ncbi:MAG: ABC transporter permease [Cyanobacteria bacterium]|nr:ABC transporter permease [Cyanobacteriota bacterium]
MSQFIETLNTELRISSRILVETIGGIKRTGWMNLIIIVTMASILSIFGTLFAFVTEVDLFTKNIGAGLKISVYTKPGYDVDDIAKTIRSLPNVQSTEKISKDSAWEEMKTNYQVPDITNPLPDTIHVQMTNQEYIEPTVTRLSQMEGIEKVNYAQSVLRKLEKVANITSIVGLAVSIFLGTLTLFIISNTIHLLIEARSREIEILRMMGIGNWYIRLPFLFQGAFYGLMGSLLALIPLSVAEYYINELFLYFQFSTSGFSQSYALMIIALMGILVGGGGAFLSVRKYLRI